ncbi:PREDICTED: zinc finger protein ZAT1-like [Camelina sativa]|uniref:Zinc finger protein ZAT1-like n=1 Tax=Camelina sativa TaxID=90675 RepID=A0ABM0WY11_CAMSA|nr:PREDICTED: zinc finger protein ZAT1-like [Camelina sativa]
MNSLLNQKRTCQVCKKSFSNGKALGGHMKSHRKLSPESSTSSITSSLRSRINLGANFRTHETVMMRSVHTNEVVGGQTPDLNQEGEQQVTTLKKKLVLELDKENSTESPALCLLQMKDMWSKSYQTPKSNDSLISTREGKDIEKYIEIDSEEDKEDSDDEYVVEDEDNEDGDALKFLTSDVGYLTADSDKNDDNYGDENAYYGAKERKGKKQSKYMCDICGKILRSYQALGGHRTSHSNKKLKISDQDVPAVRQHYECEICKRVFESGQALGGHKKIHYMFLQPFNFSTSAK